MMEIKQRKIFLSFLIGVMTIFVYFNTIENPFVWDDYDQIVLNQDIRSINNVRNIFKTDLGRGASSFYRPMQTLSYILDYHFWKLDPAGYHITNTLLHTGVSIAVFWLLLLLTPNRVGVAFAVTMLYAVHPIHTEAVTYIAGRADSLAAFFMLMALIGYIHYRLNRRAVVLIFSYLMFFLALGSREIALIFPLWILLHDAVIARGHSQDLNRRFSWGPYIGYIVIYIMYLLYRHHYVHFGKVDVMPYPLSVRLMTTVKAFPEYIRILLIPNDLHMSRQIPFSKSFADVPVFASTFLFFSVIYMAIRMRENKMVCFAILWSIICLIPAANFIPLNAAIAEHWVYLASIGWFYLLVIFILWGGKKIAGEKGLWIGGGILSVMIVSYSIVTIYQNLFWKDPIKLYTNILKFRGKGTTGIYNNLGVEYKKVERYKEAINAFQEGLKYWPEDIVLLFNMGHTYLKIKNYKAASQVFERAWKIKPDDTGVLTALANSRYLTGDFQRALETHSRIFSLTNNKHTLTITHYNMGRIYHKIGRLNEARKHFKKALKYEPNHRKSRQYLDEIGAL